MPGHSGCAFAEDATRPAPFARLLWHADLDPFVLQVRAKPAEGADPEAIDLTRLARWMTIVRGGEREHVALSDGWHRIRIDVVEGTLIDEGPARLDYLLSGLTRVDAHVLTLRRMLGLWRTGRFKRMLYPGQSSMSRSSLPTSFGRVIAAKCFVMGTIMAPRRSRAGSTFALPVAMP